MSSSNRVTMVEIAEESGVSLSTVSLVLRDRPGVGADTRERVRDVANRLGYILKSAQYRSSLQNVGLILKTEPGTTPQTNPFYSHVLAGIESACRQWQVNLLYATVPVDPDSHPLELPRLLAEEDTADGLLLVGAFLDNTVAQVVARQSTPIVLVDAYAATDAYDSVVSDNFEGAYGATTYLIEQGHRHIGLVATHPQAYPSIKERRRGYVQALQDHGIAEPCFADCHLGREEARDATVDLLRRAPQVTAILCANDEVAIVAMEAAQAEGRQIPDDLSVIGFDDIDLAEHVSPALTTMHVDKIGMGRLAIQLLINRVEYPDAGPVTTYIHPRLVERESVRRL